MGGYWVAGVVWLGGRQWAEMAAGAVAEVGLGSAACT